MHECWSWRLLGQVLPVCWALLLLCLKLHVLSSAAGISPVEDEIQKQKVAGAHPPSSSEASFISVFKVLQESEENAMCFGVLKEKQNKTKPKNNVPMSLHLKQLQTGLRASGLNGVENADMHRCTLHCWDRKS